MYNKASAMNIALESEMVPWRQNNRETCQVFENFKTREMGKRVIHEVFDWNCASRDKITSSWDPPPLLFLNVLTRSSARDPHYTSMGFECRHTSHRR